MVQLRVIDNYCINISCHIPLTEYELDRQSKSRKYRFCRKCRMLRYTSSVSWKCIGCGKTIDHGSYIGQYYCNIRGCFSFNGGKSFRGRQLNKKNSRVRARVKAFVRKHPIKKYKEI